MCSSFASVNCLDMFASILVTEVETFEPPIKTLCHAMPRTPKAKIRSQAVFSARSSVVLRYLLCAPFERNGVDATRTQLLTLCMILIFPHATSRRQDSDPTNL